MLTLYQFPGPWDVCSASCFCAKVEAYLRWQGVPHEVVSAISLKGAPKHKVPFIVDENGALGDSEAIIRYVDEKHGLSPDADLTQAQQGISRGIRYLCDEGIYRATSYYRFIDDAGWAVTKHYFLSPFPGWLRPIAAWKIRRHAKDQLWQQGIGRHSEAEVAQMVHGDLQALSGMLGGQDFFFGQRMHVADIVVFSVMSGLLTQPFDNAATAAAKRFSNLAAHTGRVRKTCFGAAA